jgi:hypothetical protein
MRPVFISGATLPDLCPCQDPAPSLAPSYLIFNRQNLGHIIPPQKTNPKPRMNINFLKTLGLFLALIAAPLCSQAQNSAPDPAIAAVAASPEFKAFLNNLRDAISSRDPERLKACFHPKSLPIVAMDKNTNAKFAKRFANPIPNECNVVINPISPTAALPFADKGVVFPVRPSHQLQITFTAADGRPTVLMIFVVSEKGKWYEVVPATPQK